MSEVIKIKECMEFTGMSRSTLYKFMKESHPDRIPFWKKGGTVFFDRNEIDKWLRNGNTK